MTDIQDMKALIERVEGASEGSYEMDIAVYKTLMPFQQVPFSTYTTSIDATEALKGGLKGEWWWQGFFPIEGPDDPDQFWAADIATHGSGFASGKSATEPLARLSAVLRAFVYEKETE